MARVSRPAEDQGRAARSMTSAPPQVVFAAGDWPCSPKTGRRRRTSPRARNRSTKEVSPWDEISLTKEETYGRLPVKSRKLPTFFSVSATRKSLEGTFPVRKSRYSARILKHAACTVNSERDSSMRPFVRS
jgi:hypothetical protein